MIAEHSEYAAELEAVLPAMRIMHNVQATDATGVGSAPPIPADDSHWSLRGRLGDFQIVREIGRGGMGVVYEAEQISLQRSVALKILPLASLLDKRHLQRFRIEARAAATLNHTNIVPIYFVGN